MVFKPIKCFLSCVAISFLYASFDSAIAMRGPEEDPRSIAPMSVPKEDPRSFEQEYREVFDLLENDDVAGARAMKENLKLHTPILDVVLGAPLPPEITRHPLHQQFFAPWKQCWEARKNKGKIERLKTGPVQKYFLARHLECSSPYQSFLLLLETMNNEYQVPQAVTRSTERVQDQVFCDGFSAGELRLVHEKRQQSLLWYTPDPRVYNTRLVSKSPKIPSGA